MQYLGFNVCVVAHKSVNFDNYSISISLLKPLNQQSASALFIISYSHFFWKIAAKSNLNNPKNIIKNNVRLRTDALFWAS